MTERYTYPFAAIAGQERMKLALILNVINPSLSGVLIRGEKGTAKSTAVRGLAELLPVIEVVDGCPFRLAPGERGAVCALCERSACRGAFERGADAGVASSRTQVVELPVGATEDRVTGTMDLEHALKHGVRRFEPGLLASAHRGILYVDEVNLLDDHVVDILLDSAAMGINTVEREGISFTHPARFTLAGTMNPEEGELRPQLLDRFGLCVTVEGARDAGERVAVMERRTSFEEDPIGFIGRWRAESERLAGMVEKAIALYPSVTIDRSLLLEIADRCIRAGVDGHRGDIVMLKAAKTLAAYHERDQVVPEDVEAAATLALPHRMRRQPMQEIGGDVAYAPLSG